uniref:putative manganese-dependent inorganic diphosphatase n=1 Tax=Ndongobacter massiliensis TaxID=1871025 RepID=UPI0009316E6A|nr:putative manganese-dependent inorganic diphosphatase [Ndongobacter massiliensis]
MKEKVYISGHRVPDTDSICSALAYAELKNRTGEMEAIPIRVGELNQETRFVLDYFGVDAPVYMESMKPKICDIEIDRDYGVSSDISLYKASELIQKNHLNSLAVVNEKDQLIGVISLSNITKSYANVWDDTILGRSQAPLENVLEVLSARVLLQPQNPRPFTGAFNIYAMSHIDNDTIRENDIVMVGNREEAQEDAIARGVSLLILTNDSPLSEKIAKQAEENRVTVLSTSYTTYMAARLIPQAVPVSFLMTTEKLIIFHLDDTLDDVQNVMAKNRYRSYPVLDSNEHVVGSISRYHLIATAKKKLILVDHNERSQSVPDIEYAEILEIIDHHRVANVMTTSPIYFRNVPVGCTATIISQIFFEQGLRPSREAAGLMCSAIISDTLLFRSPTATDADRHALERLAPIAGIDPENYAMEMFRAGTDLSTKKLSDILSEDVKFFQMEGVKVKIAQAFTMNLESLDGLKPKLVERMQKLLQEQGEDTYILVMTDIFREVSSLLVVGDYAREIARGFGQTLEQNGFSAPGVLSRKKQVVPTVTGAIAQARQEA